MNEDLHLIAQIAGRSVAIPADQVDSVVDLDTITPAPRAAPGVAGLAALRSRVVTVVDPRPLLNVADGESTRRAVVTRIEGHAYAVLVEGLEDVAGYQCVPLPAGIGLGAWAATARAMIERDGEPVLVIDLERLVPPPVALAA